MESKWTMFKKKLVQLFGTLVMEKEEDGVWRISLGRIAFWLVLVPAMWIWISGKGLLDDGTATKDISPNHLTLLLTLVAYNFGKKVTGTFEKVLGKSSTTTKTTVETESDGPG